ncbi:hypothetical protein R6Q59_025339 [Mikania micrantha]
MASHQKLLILILGFSMLVSTFTAIPNFSRTMNLIDEGSLDQTHENPEDIWEGMRLPRRMDMSTNDYPGSSANDRHTPMP